MSSWLVTAVLAGALAATLSVLLRSSVPALPSLLQATVSVCVLVGAVILVRPPRHRWTIGLLVDALVIALGVTSVALTALVPVLVSRSGQSATRVVGSLSHPLIDLLAVAALIGLIAMCRWRPPVTLWWLLAAMTVSFAADAAILTVRAVSGDADASQPLAFAAGIVATALIAIGIGRPQNHDAVVGEPSALILTAPLAGIGLAMAVLAYGTTAAVPWTAVVLALITIVASKFRLAIALWEARWGARHAELARTDDLTGLGNRRALAEADPLLTSASGDPAGVSSTAFLLLDLDRFKSINDRMGHATGDELLRVVASRLAHTVRPQDLLVRLGGDEFAVVAPNIDGDSAQIVARRIRETISGPIELRGNRLVVDVSIGIAVHPEHGPDIATLMQHADIAMYQAKHDRTGHHLFDSPAQGKQDSSLIEQLLAAPVVESVEDLDQPDVGATVIDLGTHVEEQLATSSEPDQHPRAATSD